jgi:hypothetical protein
MPIKLKCSCGQVLSVPSAMAGKTGKCPKCKKPIRIPAAAHKTSGQAQTPAKKSQKVGTAKVPTTTASGGLESLFDEVGLVQKTGPTCPSCSAAIKPGARVCTSCGLDFESGEKLTAFNAKAQAKEFENLYLQEAAENMRRDLQMDIRRDKSSMPWWVIMSFLIGAITLCGAGVVIVDGMIGTPAPETSLIGKVQRWPVFTTLGLTATITGLAITVFAHLDIVIFAFTRSWKQGLACFFLPLAYSFIYGIINWVENKAPIKAIMMALVFIGLGIFLILQGGGFDVVFDAFQ